MRIHFVVVEHNFTNEILDAVKFVCYKDCWNRLGFTWTLHHVAFEYAMAASLILVYYQNLLS